MGIIRDDGVVMKGDNEPVLVLERLLDIIKCVVALERIGLSCHLNVRAGELPARAVVVHHEVMRAEDPRVAHDF